MYSILRFFLRNKKIAEFLKNVYRRSLVGDEQQIAIPEVMTIECRRSNFEQRRLNILLPALSGQYVFGGISTALSFFDLLGKKYDNLRIILTDEQSFEHKQNINYYDWTIRSLDDEDIGGRVIIPAGNRYGKSLVVSKGDFFVATAWWTALLAKNIQRWQKDAYGISEAQKFVYLIQDYEPGFYPWSSRYVLAESTYRESDNFIAIINSKQLYDFFVSEGYEFLHSKSFNPTLHHKLKEKLHLLASVKKEARLLVYGRPSVERNAFELIVMGLREWVSKNPNAELEFVSIGEFHKPIELGEGKQLVSLGKLTIEEYANELARARIGISLMISPHPSYPPLEMAAFGINVITNKYKGKNLSMLTGLIESLDTPSPHNIANAIDKCLSKQLGDGLQKMSDDWVSYIESDGSFDDAVNFAYEILHK